MNKLLFAFSLCIISFGSVNAQDDPEPEVEEYIVDSLSEGYYKNMYPADSILRQNPVSENTVHPKKFRENLPARYKSKEFDYSTSKPRESFGQKLRRKIAQILERIFGDTVFTKSTKATETLIRIFAILLVGFLLYFIVRYLLGKDGSFIFGRKNKKVDIREEELHENIHEINFPESIARFERSGDYRSAIRYQFLFILKKLSDKKRINWNPEKTNKDYIAELKQGTLKDEFFNLSYIFDYVWYGEFNIEEQTYLKFKNQYQSFKP
ncbi:hypothetical protein CHRYSEOSP005_13690 [Chryseobacterium sp. Alg-005]|uniref:DUF4129 domain-containing protein n=1 Tax=Chryseobacterium sp. Alg-005 TaxID=3159516 RepID=UPI003555A533